MIHFESCPHHMLQMKNPLKSLDIFFQFHSSDFLSKSMKFHVFKKSFWNHGGGGNLTSTVIKLQRLSQLRCLQWLGSWWSYHLYLTGFALRCTILHHQPPHWCGVLQWPRHSRRVVQNYSFSRCVRSSNTIQSRGLSLDESHDRGDLSPTIEYPHTLFTSGTF